MDPMTASFVLAILALVFVVVGGINATRMAVELRERGMSANPLMVRWMIFKYIADYRRVTLEETGQVGPLYRMCANSFGLAAILGISAILVQVI
jgi:hypothetical protein